MPSVSTSKRREIILLLCFVSFFLYFSFLMLNINLINIVAFEAVFCRPSEYKLVFFSGKKNFFWPLMKPTDRQTNSLLKISGMLIASKCWFLKKWMMIKMIFALFVHSLLFIKFFRFFAFSFARIIYVFSILF